MPSHAYMATRRSGGCAVGSGSAGSRFEKRIVGFVVGCSAEVKTSPCEAAPQCVASPNHEKSIVCSEGRVCLRRREAYLPRGKPGE